MDPFLGKMMDDGWWVEEEGLERCVCAERLVTSPSILTVKDAAVAHLWARGVPQERILLVV
jgi:hypothetical protein